MNLNERTYLWYRLAQQPTFIFVLAISVLSSPGRTLGLDGLVFASRKESRA